MVVLAVLPPLIGPGTPAGLVGLVTAGSLLLGAPWWLVTGLLHALTDASGPVSGAVTSLLPLLGDLVVHAVVLRAVRARRGRSVAAVTADATTTGGRTPGYALAVGALLRASTWAAWLGWDRTASYDVVTGTVQTPYETLQVLGCALTVGTVTAELAARWRPVLAATGVGLGFWLVWTVDAASRDDTGLFAVGSVVLAIGLTAGTAVAASLGRGVRWALDTGRRRRSARDGRRG